MRGVGDDARTGLAELSIVPFSRPVILLERVANTIVSSCNLNFLQRVTCHG